ncbi:unnamed protein product [Cyprideis torosa]|uniref:Uncharacterized protein n=1 Tax=Cyprideis torosa TaxID=163714 RepID=A0A7R8W373_9CRUS|nr:unnamed protein product [Cyprideis torosa]CAG0882714.1 unnamed protein product [Cyprideis torosa]
MDDDTGDIPHSETTAELLDARGSPERGYQSQSLDLHWSTWGYYWGDLSMNSRPSSSRVPLDTS